MSLIDALIGLTTELVTPFQEMLYFTFRVAIDLFEDLREPTADILGATAAHDSCTGWTSPRISMESMNRIIEESSQRFLLSHRGDLSSTRFLLTKNDSNRMY